MMENEERYVIQVSGIKSITNDFYVSKCNGYTPSLTSDIYKAKFYKKKDTCLKHCDTVKKYLKDMWYASQATANVITVKLDKV